MHSTACTASGSTLKKIIRTICSAATTAADKQYVHDSINRHCKNIIIGECMNIPAFATSLHTALRSSKYSFKRSLISHNENAASAICAAATTAAQTVGARTGRG
jgi:histone deacetylase complex regulatory component SIN3